MKTQPISQPAKIEGTAYCPICTHTVPATIQVTGKRTARMLPGQKCGAARPPWTPELWCQYYRPLKVQLVRPSRICHSCGELP